MKIHSTAAVIVALTLAPLSAADDKHKDHKDHKEHAVSKHHKDGEKHKGHESHAKHMLEGYLEVAAALTKDDLAAAKEAAEEIADHDKKSSLAKPAIAIAKAKDIKAAREHFLHLSHAAIKLAETRKGYVVMVCPMVKGGEWLQTDKKVKNPYMGKKMLTCGAPKEIKKESPEASGKKKK